MTDVSVVIPNWEGAGLIDRLLDDLAHQTEAVACVLVVDNGSTDHSEAVVRARGAGWLSLEHNFGFSRAINEGVKRCKTRWVLLLNNDVRLPPPFLATLHSAAEAADAWFAAPRLVSEAHPGVLDGAFDLLCRGGCTWRAWHGRPDTEALRRERAIQFAPMTALLLRRELFERVGWLEERFESYLEDIEFFLRCALQGVQGIYAPGAEAQHRGSATLGAWSPAMVRLIARNQLLLIALHYPHGWWRTYFRPVLVAQSLWGGLALKHGVGLAWLRGKWEGLQRFRTLRHGAILASAPRLEAILTQSEAEIRELQGTAPDSFWRMYFLCAGGA
jgi:GT2 family glycosyltransferase